MTNATAYLQIKFLQNGQVCYTNLEYQCLDIPATTNDAENFVTAWEADHINALQDCISQNTVIYSLEARHSYTGGIGQTIFTLITNVPGSVESPPLPVFVTASFVKYADPDGQVGTDPNLIQRGRLQLPGVPELFVDFGLPTSAAVTAYSAFATDVLNTAVLTDDYELRIFRQSAPGVGTTKNARVASIDFRRFGTQNTRK